ncbi:Condensin complex subunit 2-barren [Babesia duncani]|uniref:Condensin complex subunit 2 n=1 Tax=Babesia duncani TaxID=323732 RepID=A0AAD9UQ58_9APIC|nr:Condensin complex subunit 2-barren [Babesia duncani]
MATRVAWQSTKRRLRPGDAIASEFEEKITTPARLLSDTPAPNTRELLNLFTECMTALSSNKICSKNAFDVGMIDHMSDMLYLEENEQQQEQQQQQNEAAELRNANLDFTRASRVVEGATRIYGYRIEAVYDQTLNVLMNINNSATLENSSNQNVQKRQKTIKRIEFSDGKRTLVPKSEVTLSKLPLDVAKLDPYFMKVSSMFDQADAEGLLLTNLVVSDDLSLNLNGDGLVFEPPNHVDANKSATGINVKRMRSIVGDLSKMEILPEAAYFRQELQRLGASLGDSADPECGQTDADPDFGPLDLDLLAPVDLDICAPMDLGPGNVSILDESTNDESEFEKPEASVTTLPDATSSPHPLMRRLEQLDPSRASEFTYFSNPLESEKRSTFVEKVQKHSEKSKIVLPRLQEILQQDIHKVLDSIELSNLSQKRLVPMDPSRIAGICFKFSDSLLCHLDTLGNRLINYTMGNGSVDSPPTNGHNNSLPQVKIAHADDYEALYVNRGWTRRSVDSSEESSGTVWRQLQEPGALAYMDSLDTYPEELPTPSRMEQLTATKDSNQMASPVVPQYIDIFKVKNCMCSVLLPSTVFHDTFEDVESQKRALNVPKPIESRVSFQEAIKSTLEKLDPKQAQAINTHMLLVCLLHVCNEQNLVLQQQEPLADFEIVANADEKMHYQQHARF